MAAVSACTHIRQAREMSWFEPCNFHHLVKKLLVVNVAGLEGAQRSQETYQHPLRAHGESTVQHGLLHVRENVVHVLGGSLGLEDSGDGQHQKVHQFRLFVIDNHLRESTAS